MKNKQYIIPILVLGIFLFIAMASASITFINPTTGNYINGTINFNVTTAIVNALACNWSTTANSNFLDVSNFSAGQTTFNKTYNTASLTEVASTSLTANCSNATASEVGSITIGIDNTNPTCSFIIDLLQTTRQSGMGITATDYSSDTTTITYLYNLTNEESVQKTTSTSQNPTFSNGDLEDLGEFTINLTVTDLVSKTSSCTQTFLVKPDDKGDKIITQISKQKSSNATLFIISGAVIILIILIAITWFVLEGSKK